MNKAAKPKNVSKREALKTALKLRKTDAYRECLDFIDRNEIALGADADYLRGEIHASAEKRLHGIERNSRKAVAHYRKAAGQGHSEASYELGRILAMGTGVKEDIDGAVVSLRAAAANHHTLAAFELANLLYEHSEREDAIDAIALYEQLAHDDVLGRSALLKLGRIYMRGFGRVAPDHQRGIALLQQAAKLGNANAWMDLAYAYFRGKGIDRDLERARHCAEQAGSDHILYDEVMAFLNAPEA